MAYVRGAGAATGLEVVTILALAFALASIVGSAGIGLVYAGLAALCVGVFALGGGFSARSRLGAKVFGATLAAVGGLAIVLGLALSA